MMKRFFKLALLVSASALLLNACGGSDADKAAPVAGPELRSKLKGKGDKAITDLPPADQQEVKQSLSEYLQSVNWTEMAKLECRGEALSQKTADKCTETLNRCLEAVSKLKEEDLKAEIKKNDDAIIESLKAANASAEDLLDGLEMVNTFAEAAKDLNCNSSDKEKQAQGEKAVNSLKAKFSEEKQERAMKAFEAFISLDGAEGGAAAKL